MTTPNLTTSPAPGMQSATHSPGPWIREESELGICRLFVTVEDVDTFLISSPAGEIGHLHRGTPEDEANARLITASPDLLAALGSIMKSSARIPVGLREMASRAISKAVE